MTHNYSAPWHRASYDTLIYDRLPALLADRLPVVGYRAESVDTHTCRVTFTLVTAKREVEARFDLPQPDESGVFLLDGQPRVVVPIASSEDLDTAEIRCVGEQLYDYLDARIIKIPAVEQTPWAEFLLEQIPLDELFRNLLLSGDRLPAQDIPSMRYTPGELLPTGQRLDTTNWLARQTHLRRVIIPGRTRAITPGQFGRVCPFETPEGPNLGSVFSVALGAEICDGQLVITDDRPEAALGLTASTIPFLEHNDANRQLFGVNMMRQWVPTPHAEPAMVRTGSEPAVPEFWCGFNLLTAFVPWGEDTYEDALLISESCARRMQYDTPLEAGDKFSNRHGTKGVISRIMPDAEMPHLPDGTPVELVYNSTALHTRLNFGQEREAVMSRIARAEGQPAIVAPFHAPSEDELRTRLVKAGLPKDGMEHLTRYGEALPYPSLVGWVYWGRTFHIADTKIHQAVDPSGRAQVQGELEYVALRDIGAFATIAETYNTRSAEREDAATLAARVASGPIAQAAPPTPRYAALHRRLSAAGIQLEFENDELRFRLAEPSGEALALAAPMPHPWLHDHEVGVVGVLPDMPEYDALAFANEKLARLLADHAPQTLQERARKALAERVREYFDALITPEQLRVRSRVLFSGRTVLTPGVGLRLDQLGVADELAWGIFGPLATREVGQDAVQARSETAAVALDAIMARSWAILNRAPTFMPTSLLAFHPVRVPDRTLRLHPLACMLMNADFDGDQAAIFLPLTEEGQREAGELLSIAGHLRRDPSLARWLFPAQDALWGLALLSQTAEGKAEIVELAGIEVPMPAGFLTRDAITAALQALLARDGVKAMLEAAQRLWQRGLAVAQSSGLSMNPFIGSSLPPIPQPEDDDPAAWQVYGDEVLEQLASRTDFADPDLGPQLLVVKSGARGSFPQLRVLVDSRGLVTDAAGAQVAVRHGYRHGLTPEELFATVAGAREGLARTARETTQMGYGLREARGPQGFGVLARALRAAHPGVVFANAAAHGEVDLLTDLDSRLFVGLAIK